MILTKKILGACLIAAKDDVRPTLASVKLGEGKAVATDGYRLIILDITTDIQQADIPSADHEPLVDDAHLLKAGELKKALENIPAKGALPVLKTAWTAQGDKAGSVKIVSTDLDTRNVLELMEVDADFPKYEKIVDETKEAPVQASVKLDAKLLIGLLQAIVKSGGEYVTIEIREDYKPVVITSKDQDRKEIFSLIMPVRKEEK